MSYEYVIDSYAWIECFRGSKAGDTVRPYVEGDQAATSAITLAELKEKYLREGRPSFQEDSEFMVTRTLIVPIDHELATLAGELNYARKKTVRDWGMADSLVLATARKASAKVVTGDNHFKGLQDAIIV